MPKRLSSKEVAAVLLGNGFWKARQGGTSHQIFTDGPHVVVVPAHRKDLPPGTLSSIIRQSGLGRRAFGI